MHVWKAGGLALILGSAAFVMPSGARAQDRVLLERDVLLPAQRALEMVMGGGGSRIGVSVAEVGAGDVGPKKLTSQAGALIQAVEEDTPAARAGLKAGDVIIEFDGERVRGTRQLTRLIQETPAGRQAAVVVWRDGQRVALSVAPESPEHHAMPMPGLHGDGTLERQPRRGPGTPRARRAPMPEPFSVPSAELLPEQFGFSAGRGRLGVGTQTLSDQLAKHFGVDEGVLVTEVAEDSAAAKAGIRAGDVITKVNGASVEDASDLRRALGQQSGEIAVEIVRDRKTQTVKATIEAPRTRTIRRVI